MNQFLNQYDFTLALNSNTAEFIWLYLKIAINSALNLYAPKISERVSQINKNQIKSKLKVIDLQRELQRMISDTKHD